MTDLLAALLLILGAVFVLVGSIGLRRFPDFFTRLHVPTKATTLGLAAVIAAYILYDFGRGDGLQIREFLITLFLFLTVPISAHMVARSAIRRRVESAAELPGPLEDEKENEQA